ncbi:TatD family hydrolase [Parvularcula dongshanensis]|uniref:TatD DNase family protein n=1 Tax=Parvularcula dongshanensis TaxID=1173995 RepID=A0A840I572_9PROT|nr:TatD family hydrolase [Parvularcula dongshanensis]MBB4659475.1 TatD DNase family protein [Parvularcula dongshanensis]
MLVDSHVNLHGERYAEDLEDVLARAAEAGVGAMLAISDHLGSTDEIAGIVAGRRNLWRTVGVHPHWAKDAADLTPERLVALAEADDVVAIGECGLDRHYEYSGFEDQERVFRAHVRAAQRTGLPLVIHAREADAEMEAILTEMHEEAPFTPLLHCYTGGPGLMQAALKRGGYVSVSGIVTFKTADAVRETARRVPLDRLLLETDCPFLSPVPHRGRRNEPAYLPLVAQKVAEVRGVSVGEIEAATTENFFRLFSKAKLSA